MGSAFLHRAPETEDEERAARIYFTLKLPFILAWLLIMVGATLVFAEGPTRTALLLLTATTTGTLVAETPRLILLRRVQHRRLALAQILTAVSSTVVAVSLAWWGVTLWALLVTDIAAFLVMIIVFYLWRPIWRPRLAWSPEVVRYYLKFGSRTFVAGGLQKVLDRLDDLWTRFYLGVTPMGFYSRAYAFATYPRRVLAAPVAAVIGGTYAELKGDRRRLSKTFFRANALLVRGGFLLAGLLALVAPEFIRILLGEKWMPMLYPFRLMLVYTMLDPIKGTIASLFTAVGRPGIVVRARAVQLAVLVVGLLLLSSPLGITGVALAVTAMVAVGILMLLWQARSFVSFSVIRLFGVPTVALAGGMILARAAIVLPGVLGSDWRTAIVKISVFGLVYCALLIGAEHREISRLLFEARQQLRQSPRGDRGS
jgi:O-antigen/teichoic acid export membrane protein